MSTAVVDVARLSFSAGATRLTVNCRGERRAACAAHDKEDRTQKNSGYMVRSLCFMRNRTMTALQRSQ